jgi:hypothetical protein
LVGHLSPFDAEYQHRLYSLKQIFSFSTGSWAAERLAPGTIFQELMRQARLLSYVDSFRDMGLISLLCIPIAFLFKKTSHSDEPPMMH